MNRLTHIHIEGFKSIREADLELRPLNVLIGANASGKSNFLSLFRMLNTFPFQDLELNVAQAGGADSLLHYGSRNTSQIAVRLDYATKEAPWYVEVRFLAAEPDTLVFRRGQGEGLLPAPRAPGRAPGASSAWAGRMAGWAVYHFGDTSESAPIRKQCYKDDNRYLQADAGNLAACLHLLRETARPYYDRIVRTVQLAFPGFGDFDVEPLGLNPRGVMLNWREVGRDQLFGPHQLSDGTLRFMALATLLLQPGERLPDLILIDEPELGLHPAAISLVAGLLRSASVRAQVIVATQSVSLLDEFEPDEVVVTERRGGETTFRRPDPDELADWLEAYSLGELWEKNVIGGRP